MRRHDKCQKHLFLLPIVAAPLGVALCSGSLAAESGAPSYGALEEVIVTAHRREESLARTAVAATVLSAETISKALIVSEQDLRATVPGLSVRAAATSETMTYSLRGQSQDVLSNSRPGVLPYLNEVQVGGGGGVSSLFYDIASIQVLKGPQGTLFGRNSTGGAVLMTSAKPTDVFTGFAKMRGGSEDERAFSAALSGPIIQEKLLARIAGSIEKRDGFQKNLFDGSREGDLDRYGVRGSLTAVPTERLRNELVVDYYHSDSENTLPVLSGIVPITAASPPPFFPGSLLYGGTDTPLATGTGIFLGQAVLGGVPGTPPEAIAAYADFYTAYFADPSHPTNGMVGQLAEQQERGPFKINVEGPNRIKAESTVVTNITSLDINEGLKLRNIFGYTDIRNGKGWGDTASKGSAADVDGMPYGFGENVGTKSTLEQYSEELQVLGTDALGGRLDYVAGVYFGDDKVFQGIGGLQFDILFGGLSSLNVFKLENKSYAGYAQGTYDLNSSGLSATLGLRYTSEKVSKKVHPEDQFRAGVTAATGVDAAPPGFDYDQSETFNQLAYQVGIQSQINENVLLYAVHRRSYRAGGFNGTNPPFVGGSDVGGDFFDEERVMDVEVGFKYAGEVAGRPARFNVAAYQNWVKDAQRSVFASTPNAALQALTVGVPKGENYGIEIDGIIRVVDWLDVGAAFNYTHAEYTDGTVVLTGIPQEFDQVPDTPEYSGSIFADATWQLTGSLTANLHGDAYAQSSTDLAPQSINRVGATTADYTIANFRAGLSHESGWSLAANVKNAFDKTYYVGGFTTGLAHQLNTKVPGFPRTYSVELSYSF